MEEPAKPTRFEWPEDGDSDSAPLLYSSTFDDISYDSVPIVKSINSIVQSALPPSPSQPLVVSSYLKAKCELLLLKENMFNIGF